MLQKEKISELQSRIALYDDMKAYQELYEMLFSKLKNYCFSYVKSGEAAEELVSDVFIKIWQIRNRLPEIENLKLYLYTIAKNFSLNYITKNYKNPVTSLEEMDIEPVISFGNPEELCISADILHQIHQCLRLLPPQCRLIFQMVKEDGFTYKEVASHLNISVLTVRNQVFIATRKIAEVIPAYILSNAGQLVKPADR
ncbi:RNA polymerase sigma-70 factor [Ferruginibacter sp.]|nr:RNA polymerase sigma-70 factor [Ferruginibacter sp.]